MVGRWWGLNGNELIFLFVFEMIQWDGWWGGRNAVILILSC